MMNYIWAGIIIISIISAIYTGRINELSNAVIDGATNAVELIISMLGMMCVWTGFMKIAEKGGLTKVLAKFLSPVLKRLFSEYKNDEETLSAISLNITANFLGLGNAATPFGIEAMKKMQNGRTDKNSKIANNSMIMFIVINTASLQLIPSMLMILRANYGSKAPLDIMPCVWLTSIAALTTGIIITKLLESRNKLRGRV